MSAWGTKNFERDDALNVLQSWYSAIIDDIRKTFKYDNNKSLYEDHGESRIVGNIDILTNLLIIYQSTPNIELEEIKNWKKDYLQTFDRTIIYYDPEPEYLRERRNIVVNTFEKLEKEIIQLWED